MSNWSVIIGAALIAGAILFTGRYQATPGPWQAGAWVSDTWTGRAVFIPMSLESYRSGLGTVSDEARERPSVEDILGPPPATDDWQTIGPTPPPPAGATIDPAPGR